MKLKSDAKYNRYLYKIELQQKFFENLVTEVKI